MPLASAYAVLGITHPGTLPAPELAGLLAECSFVPIFTGIGFMLLLFPSGTLPSPRWRPFAGLGLLATALTMAGFVVRPGLVALPAPGGASLTFANPLGIRSLGPVLSTVLIGTLNGLAVLVTVLLAAAFVSLAVRYRPGGREVRQQIKWIALAAVAGTGCQIAALLAIAATGDASNPVTVAAYVVMTAHSAVRDSRDHHARDPEARPVPDRRHHQPRRQCTACSRPRSRPYTPASWWASGRSPVTPAARCLRPRRRWRSRCCSSRVRRRAQLVANRLVYGQRATPYQVLADFAQDMAGQLDADAALNRMASVLAGATGAVRVEIWIRLGAQLRPQVTWPHGSTPPTAVPLTSDAQLPAFDAATRAIAVRHTGELLGAITIEKPRNEPVSAAEDRLLEHLASQAGLVLRNVRLTAELQASIDDVRASRRRLVNAQDQERRRIERNLHDGAQQQLVALTVQLTLLEDSAKDPGEVRQMAGQLRAGLHAALDDLRALARGIYPPLLADQGLGAALRAQAGKAPLPVGVEADGIGRYPPDAEAAVYFCTLEALQNVAKYARASQATVALSCPDGHLKFTITDDGGGFDTTTATHGTGLQGMADRLAAAGGALRIHSAPGLGTTISGTLPVPGQSGTGEKQHS